MTRLLREMFGELGAWGRFWLWLGLITLGAAAAMSFDFGWSVSAKHAIFLACLTVIAAFVPECAYRQWKQGRKIVAGVLSLICVPLLAIEFYSHAGYTAGLRGHNITEAKVQNVKHSNAHEAVADDRQNLEMWRKQLADLTAAHAWAPTVKADGLRAQIESAQKAIDLEAARGGCKAKCLALMKTKASLEERIAIAEQASDITKRIEATQRILDEKRTKAATVEHKSSPVVHQNEFLARALALTQGSLKPSEFLSEGAQQSVNLAMAVAGTCLPALAIFLAGLYRREEDEPAQIKPVQTTPAIQRIVERVPDKGRMFPLIAAEQPST